MEYKITYNEEKDYFFTTMSGSFKYHSILDFTNEIQQHPKFNDHIKEIIDFSDVTFDHIDITTSLRDMEEIIKSIDNTFGTAKCAILIKEKIAYGLAKMWILMSKGRIKVSYEVFFEKEKAIHWLGIE